jgi:hypothetical protein
MSYGKFMAKPLIRLGLTVGGDQFPSLSLQLPAQQWRGFRRPVEADRWSRLD